MQKTSTDNFLVHILNKLVTGKISPQVYVLRGKIMKKIHKEEILPNKLKLISCVTTLQELLTNLMTENFLPWGRTTDVLCRTCKYKELIKTVSIPVNNIDDFETNINSSLRKKSLFCTQCFTNSKEVEFKINDFLIFIEWTD